MPRLSNSFRNFSKVCCSLAINLSQKIKHTGDRLIIRQDLEYKIVRVLCQVRIEVYQQLKSVHREVISWYYQLFKRLFRISFSCKLVYDKAHDIHFPLVGT